MNERQPPKLATWLLTRFGYGARKESLIGDLHEQFVAGESDAWYWRQSAMGLATSAVTFARAEGVALIGALAAAWGVMVLAFGVNALLVKSLPLWSRPLRQLSMHGYLTTIFFIDTSIRFAMFVAAGWILARMQPRHRYIALALLIASAALWRFVPQRIAPVFEPSTHVMLHTASAIVGLMVGALLLTRQSAARIARG
jgi:hypothetical protein